MSKSRDVGSLCADFGLPRLLCSQLWPDVRTYVTDVRQHRLCPRLLGVGHNKRCSVVTVVLQNKACAVGEPSE